MKLFVSLLPSMRPVERQTDIAVVIDVLRATSVMTTALAAGADKFITCQSVDEAKSLAEQLQPRPLLCGERECRLIEGFDLGNSPAEYSSSVVSARTLILTTTNGTRAIAAAQHAQRMIVASFLNLSAVVGQLENVERAHLICAGTNGEVTAEDTLLAGAIINSLDSDRIELCGDEGIVACGLWRSWFPSRVRPDVDSLSRRFAESQGGKNLINVGFEADLSRCAAIDLVDVVPERIVAQPPTFALTAN